MATRLRPRIGQRRPAGVPKRDAAAAGAWPFWLVSGLPRSLPAAPQARRRKAKGRRVM